MQFMKIYCDESRQNGHKYKLIGGIWIPQEYCRPFVDDFLRFCDNEVRTRPRHMKWKKVPSPGTKYMKFYTGLVDLYFEYAFQQRMDFRVIVADDEYKLDHPDYHGGDPEKGFYTLYYELIVHALRPNCRYHVRVGHREVSRKVRPLTEMDRLRELHEALNNGFAKIMRERRGRVVAENVVLSVEPRHPQQRILMQLADILTGATGFHWHGGHLRPGAKEGKVYLAKRIAGHLGRKDLRFTSERLDRVFNVFYIKPRGRKQ